MKAIHVLAALAAATTITASPAAADKSTPNYTSLTVFGDSLVDAGNIAIITGGATPSPTRGYFAGRFTNGYDYTDLLSIDLFGRPTTASLAGGSNFAYGGARIVANNDGIPDLTAQIGLYQQRLAAGATVDRNGLYILNMGGNDIFAVGNNDIGGRTITQYLQAAATEYAANVQALNDLGVRNILLTDFPVATAPAVNDLANTFLTAALGKLTLAADTTFYKFSYADFFTRLQTDPGQFGLPTLNTTVTCQQANAFATGCAGYFSIDGTHPTAAVQRALYAEMNRQFALAVPEPATWLLMMLGFGMVAATLRRRPAVRVRFA